MRIAFFSASLLASSLVMAATPINGWYSSVFGGYTYMPGNLGITTGGLTLGNTSYESGFNAGGRIGYASNPLRYEAEFTYIDAEVNKFYVNNIKQTGVTGDTSASLGMANVYYDFPDMVPAIQPFIGVGLGYGYVEGTFKSRGPLVPIRYNGSDGVFAYQATAGFTYNFAENYAVNIAYRYIGTESVDSLGKVFQANLGTVAVIYRFNENNYK